jgi:2-polyprenyl-3-methyl-5-hydroxy-6-metoxy-1,4-benzoquinol methylase
MDLEAVERFTFKVAGDHATARAGALAYIGDKLGIWEALAGSGPVTSAELAQITNLNERYLREWLATQAAVGYIEFEPASGRYVLPPEHAAVLAVDGTPTSMVSGFQGTHSFFAAADPVAEAFRSGGGVAWGDHHPNLYEATDRFFRPLYEASLVSEWLPALEGVVPRLQQGATVLDVGCGHGSSTILMAQAFPQSTFHGIDVHEESIVAARQEAAKAGVEDRVTFEVAAIESYERGGFDLACFFDSFHHVGDPQRAARQVRQVLAPGGKLLLVEPLAGTKVEDNLNLVGLIYYSASTLICVPDAIAQGAEDALGGQAGPARLIEILQAAGFEGARVAAEAPFNIVVEGRR